MTVAESSPALYNQYNEVLEQSWWFQKLQLNGVLNNLRHFKGKKTKLPQSVLFTSFRRHNKDFTWTKIKTARLCFNAISNLKSVHFLLSFSTQSMTTSTQYKQVSTLHIPAVADPLYEQACCLTIWAQVELKVCGWLHGPSTTLLVDVYLWSSKDCKRKQH